MSKEWFSASELAGLPGLPSTPRGVSRYCSRLGLEKRDRNVGKGWEYAIAALPAETQSALYAKYVPVLPSAPDSPGAVPPHSAAPTGAEAFNYDPASLWLVYEGKSENLKAQAQRRYDALHNALGMIVNGVPREKAMAITAQTFSVDRATLYRWYSRVLPYAREDWVAVLAPGYVGGVAKAECTAIAWEYFKTDYLRLSAPAATACYDRLVRAAPERGWSVPSLSTLMRRLEREVPVAVRVASREGKEALQRLYPAQERDRSVFHALEAVNADGHKFDVFVKWSDGEITRPVIVAWQDIYSGKLLGWRLDKTENTDAVRLSFGDVVERYGIPSAAYLDNGRAFASKWLTGGIPNRYRFKVKEEEPAGILKMLGVEVHWVTPYHGQAKPIERAWRDLCESIAKHPVCEGAYTGNSPSAKPENYGSTAVPIERFRALCEQEIAAHNARLGRASAVCNGRSFDVTFSESYKQNPIRKATGPQRRLWLLANESVRVSGGVVVLEIEKRNRYMNPVLIEHDKKQVVVRFDPQALHGNVHVYTHDGRYLCEAECMQAAGHNDVKAARELARAKNDWLRSVRAQSDAAIRLDVKELAQFDPPHVPEEPVESNVVKPLFRKTGTDSSRADEAPKDTEFIAAVAMLKKGWKPPL